MHKPKSYEEAMNQIFIEQDELLQRLAQTAGELSEAHPLKDEDIWQLMERLFHALGNEDAGEFLANAVENGFLSIEQATATLNCGMWAGKTNGADLKPTLDGWLRQQSDFTRIKMALYQDIYPLDAGPEMREILTRLAQKWPELAPRCQVFLS